VAIVTFWVATALINGLISSGFGFFVYLKNKTNPINRLWAIFCATIAFWSFSYFFWQVSSEKELALLWCRILMIGAIFIPVTFLHFLLVWLDLYLQNKRVLYVSYGVSVAAVILDFTPFFVKGVRQISYFTFWPEAGATYLPFVIFWAWLVSYCWYILFREMHISVGIKRNQIKYVLFPAIIGFSGGFTNYPLWFGIKIPPYGNILVSLYVIVMGYAIVKYNLMDIQVVVKDAFSRLVALVTAIALVILGSSLFKSLISLKSILIFAAGCLTGIIILYPLYRFLRDIISQAVRPRPDFDTILRDYTQIDMLAAHTSKGLADLVVRRITDSMNPTVCSLMLLDETTGLYNVVASSGKAEEIKTIAFKPSNHLIAALKNAHHTRLIVKDELNKIFPQDQANLIRRDLEILKCQISIPLILHRELIGLVNLGTKSSGELYTPEEIGFLFVFLTQSAFMMRFLDEMQRIHEIEVRAEKLAGMTNLLDGFHHEFRNQIGTVKFFMENYDKPEYQEAMKEYRQTAGESFDVIVAILDAAEKYRESSEMKEISHIHIKEPINSALLHLKSKFYSIKAKITSNIAEDLPKIETYPSFQYLFPNLLMNCYFALSQRQTRLLNIQARASKDSQRPIEIVVTDTGGDMVEAMKETTFSSGGKYFPERSKIGGIYFFLANHIIEDHNGELIVETNTSTKEKGTIFIIKLPLRQPREDVIQ